MKHSLVFFLFFNQVSSRNMSQCILFETAPKTVTWNGNNLEETIVKQLRKIFLILRFKAAFDNQACPLSHTKCCSVQIVQ